MSSLFVKLLQYNFETPEEQKNYLEACEYTNALTLSVYKDYRNNKVLFKQQIFDVMADIKRNLEIFTKDLLCDLFISICKRIEYVEHCLYGESIYGKDALKRTVGVLEVCEGNSEVYEVARTYVDVLCYNYKDLSSDIQPEASSFYRFKCDVIDTFTGEFICQN